MPHVFSAERLGIKKGIQQGMQEVVLSQMDARFGAVPDEIQKRIQDMKDAERLKKIARMLVTVQSLDELRRAMD